MMPRKSIEERIKQLDAQKQALLARHHKQERARDTRRKILLGALVMHRLDQSHDPDFTRRLADWLRRELPDFLARDTDRALFADLLGPLDAAPAHGDAGDGDDAPGDRSAAFLRSAAAASARAGGRTGEGVKAAGLP